MNIDQLPYMIAIATAGNLSSAARQIGVSQQALSKYLAEQEAMAGLELFFRNKRRYLPTPAGRLYIEAAQRILDLRRHTVNALSRSDGRQTGTLRLGVSPNRGIEIMAQVYPMFERRYPHVQLSLTEGYANELRDHLTEGRIDALLTGHLGPVPQGFQAIAIHSEELVLAVPSFHPLVSHSTTRLEDLPLTELKRFRDELFIQPQPSSNLHGMVQSLFDAENFHPRVTVSLPNIRLQLAMVRSGTHVALLPSYYVGTDPDIAFFRLHDSPRMIMAYMTRGERTMSEAERYLVWLLISVKLRHDEAGVLWNDTVRDIVSEFGPAEVGGLV